MAELQEETQAIIPKEEKETTTTKSLLNVGVEGFESDKFSDSELELLGINSDVSYYRIEFNNDKTVSYLMVFNFLISLTTVVLWPFFLCCWCCIQWGFNKHAKSRKAALTNDHFIVHQGQYTCYCCCWGEKTKSVPLEKSM